MGDGVPGPMVRKFREILLWPLQLEPLAEGRQIQKHWEVLKSLPGGSVWAEVEDEFRRSHAVPGAPLPRVRDLPAAGAALPLRRGPARGGALEAGRLLAAGVPAPRHRHGAHRAQRHGDAPVVLEIAHVDLYFFYDLDVVILAVEVFGDDLPLDTVQDMLFRFGRAYPPYWESRRAAAPPAPHRTEWLDAAGHVLATSDFGERAKYLEFVCEHRAPLHRLALGLRDAPARAAHVRRGRAAALPAARVLPHAGDGLPRRRRPAQPHARRLRAPRAAVSGPGRSRRAAVLRGLPARLRAPLLLRPLLRAAGRARRERDAHAHLRPRL